MNSRVFGLFRFGLLVKSIPLSPDTIEATHPAFVPLAIPYPFPADILRPIFGHTDNDLALPTPGLYLLFVDQW